MFKIKHRYLLYFIPLLVSIVLLLSHPSYFSSIKFKIISLISFPARIISFPLFEIKKILYYHRTFDEYMRLRKEVASLKRRLIGMEEIIRENTRLQKLLDFKRRLVYSSVTASVIGREPSLWNSIIIIDKGSDDGIKVGMPVVNALGVVGKIGEVSKDKAKVILLTDPRFSVAALVKESRESVLVSGTLEGGCRVKYIYPGAKIRIGDMVITSKLSLSFPEGLLIGTIVEKIENPSGTNIEYVLQPAVSFSQLEEVLIIRK